MKKAYAIKLSYLESEEVGYDVYGSMEEAEAKFDYRPFRFGTPIEIQEVFLQKREIAKCAVFKKPIYEYYMKEYKYPNGEHKIVQKDLFHFGYKTRNGNFLICVRKRDYQNEHIYIDSQFYIDKDANFLRYASDGEVNFLSQKTEKLFFCDAFIKSINKKDRKIVSDFSIEKVDSYEDNSSYESGKDRNGGSYSFWGETSVILHQNKKFVLEQHFTSADFEYDEVGASFNPTHGVDVGYEEDGNIIVFEDLCLQIGRGHNEKEGCLLLSQCSI